MLSQQILNKPCRVINTNGIQICVDADSSTLTGKSMSFGTIFKIKSIRVDAKNLSRNFFEADQGGWILADDEGIINCEILEDRDSEIIFGKWSYEIVNPAGAKFASSMDYSGTIQRKMATHRFGSTVVANCKRVERDSTVTQVQLMNNDGWLFEHSITTEILDRRGSELIVVAIDGLREKR